MIFLGVMSGGGWLVWQAIQFDPKKTKPRDTQVADSDAKSAKTSDPADPPPKPDKTPNDSNPAATAPDDATSKPAVAPPDDPAKGATSDSPKAADDASASVPPPSIEPIDPGPDTNSPPDSNPAPSADSTDDSEDESAPDDATADDGASEDSDSEDSDSDDSDSPDGDTDEGDADEGEPLEDVPLEEDDLDAEADAMAEKSDEKSPKDESDDSESDKPDKDEESSEEPAAPPKDEPPASPSGAWATEYVDFDATKTDPNPEAPSSEIKLIGRGETPLEVELRLHGLEIVNRKLEDSGRGMVAFSLQDHADELIVQTVSRPKVGVATTPAAPPKNAAFALQNVELGRFSWTSEGLQFTSKTPAKGEEETLARRWLKALVVEISGEDEHRYVALAKTITLDRLPLVERVAKIPAESWPDPIADCDLILEDGALHLADGRSIEFGDRAEATHSFALHELAREFDLERAAIELTREGEGPWRLRFDAPYKEASAEKVALRNEKIQLRKEIIQRLAFVVNPRFPPHVKVQDITRLGEILNVAELPSPPMPGAPDSTRMWARYLRQTRRWITGRAATRRDGLKREIDRLKKEIDEAQIEYENKAGALLAKVTSVSARVTRRVGEAGIKVEVARVGDVRPDAKP